MVNGKLWTEDEDIYLEYFVYENDKEIKEAAEFLKRSPGAVYTRLDKLRKSDSSVNHSLRRWSEKEKEYLKNNYTTLTVKMIAKKLSRTESAIAYQMQVLKLRKIKSIEVYDEDIRKLASSGYYRRQAARMLNISNSSLTQYSQRNGIEFRNATAEETTAKIKELMQKEYKRHEFRNKKGRERYAEQRGH